KVGPESRVVRRNAVELRNDSQLSWEPFPDPLVGVATLGRRHAGSLQHALEEATVVLEVFRPAGDQLPVERENLAALARDALPVHQEVLRGRLRDDLVADLRLDLAVPRAGLLALDRARDVALVVWMVRGPDGHADPREIREVRHRALVRDGGLQHADIHGLTFLVCCYPSRTPPPRRVAGSESAAIRGSR